MKKLRLLIVCLLVVCNGISQTVIKDSVVTLKKETAREVIKDLIRLDACVLIQKEQENLIVIQKKKIKLFEDLTAEFEAVSFEKSQIIENQNKIINKLQKPKLHLYVGIRNDLLEIDKTTAFSNLLFCTKKIEFGIHANVGVNSNLTYGITTQYKVF